MSKYSSQAPFIASYMLFMNAQGQLAFLLRANTPWMNGFYTLPSGKVEPDEFFIDCAVRESKEEVGAEVAPRDVSVTHIMHRAEPDGFWVDAYITVREWKGELYNAEPHVHSELAWFAPDKLPDNVLPGTKVALQHISRQKFYSEYTRGKNDI